MDRNVISQRQTDALKLETLRAYFDFREGRPTAETVAEKLGIPVRTVRDWLADNRNGELLDELVPLWPNIGSARQFASEHAQEALETLVSLMRSTKIPRRTCNLDFNQSRQSKDREPFDLFDIDVSDWFRQVDFGSRARPVASQEKLNRNAAGRTKLVLSFIPCHAGGKQCLFHKY